MILCPATATKRANMTSVTFLTSHLAINQGRHRRQPQHGGMKHKCARTTLKNLGAHERGSLSTIEALGGKVTYLVGPPPRVSISWPKGRKVTAASVIEAFERPARRRRAVVGAVSKSPSTRARDATKPRRTAGQQ
jgi:hypothetical protein